MLYTYLQIFQKEEACNGSVKHVSCVLRTNYTNSTIAGVIYEEAKFCSTSKDDSRLCNLTYDLHCEEDIEAVTDCIYKTVNFWAFVVLMSVGTIGFNVVNSITDAICFDVIGKPINVNKIRFFVVNKNHLQELNLTMENSEFGVQLVLVPLL